MKKSIHITKSFGKKARFTIRERITRKIFRELGILGRTSYSQAGEDRAVGYIFNLIGKTNPTYLDIGSNHPHIGSNTFLFYQLGSTGVCVDANPKLCAAFSRARPRDTVINVGIGVIEQEGLPFYCFGPEADGMSSFSKSMAEAYENTSVHKVCEVITVPVVTINSIMKQHFPAGPDFLSIDVEGLDREILDSLDFDQYSPTIICAETHCQSAGKYVKDKQFVDFVISKGYEVCVDTYINTIFLKADQHVKLFS